MLIENFIIISNLIVLYALSGPYFHFSQAITPSLLATIVVPAGVARNIYAGPVHIEYYIDTKDQYKSCRSRCTWLRINSQHIHSPKQYDGPDPTIPAVPGVIMVTTRTSRICSANVKYTPIALAMKNMGST